VEWGGGRMPANEGQQAGRGFLIFEKGLISILHSFFNKEFD
jgi:hypothetical protein